ncbi:MULTISPECIES: mammalian cell entry protein [Mycobacterium]|uniref:Mammalian cell entry protein n=1 Tax=Mycobacterium syngnathidarum TaxID=1908205 RepID=A0A1Q9WHE1_9MYCO|nr:MULTISPECIES: mammalian cell entry protein [Mycobacterium]MCG7606842.1 mammalian cell entry protein [Mycobacterium sp. CnD-18-1]OHT92537.1 mammalian cell entry protein [Mycobacterium syngnathidarum]OLT98227.1 mammalian cell entry protein [Mycobacterium syngnathidarum]
MEDQPADSGDLTTGEPEKPRRRLRFGRRRRAEAADVAVEASTSDDVETPADAGSDEADGSEATPERRTPTGKAGRKAVVEPEPAVESEASADVESEVTAEPEPETEADADVTDAESEPVVEAETEPAEDAPDEDTSAEDTSAEDVVLVPHREAGKRLTYFAAGAAAVFVAAAAFGGAMLQPYLADRALVATKLQVARTSADAITTLWTYNPDNIETLPDRAEKYLSGDFADQYRKLIDSLVPTNKQAQVTNNTEVMGTAVETISRDEATAIVYTNTVSTSPVTKNVPSLRYMSYRLVLHRTDGDWRITQMPALTQLDLSPQL